MDDSTEFRFDIAPNRDYYTRCVRACVRWTFPRSPSFPTPPPYLFSPSCSFMTDYQLEIDARIVLDLLQTTDGPGHNGTSTESLYPERHRITLPLNGLNNLFEDVSVTFNHSSKLESDR